MLRYTQYDKIVSLLQLLEAGKVSSNTAKKVHAPSLLLLLLEIWLWRISAACIAKAGRYEKFTIGVGFDHNTPVYRYIGMDLATP